MQNLDVFFLSCLSRRLKKVELAVIWEAMTLISRGLRRTLFFISEVEEYCQWETFNASCSEEEVVVMTSARYGRMKLGKCLTADYQVGCSADVLSHVDTRCSGRPTCVITIPDPALFNVQPCRKDLVAYFSSSYDCLKGEGRFICGND